MTNKTLPHLVRACYRETLERPPVWFMRQAGRYLPEYRAIRQKVDFLQLCKNPDLAAEVSLQPYRRFGMDGVIMFSDILIPVEAMGMPLAFTEKGPHLTHPLRDIADIDRLQIPDPLERTGFVAEIIQRLRQTLASSPEVAVIGFAGAPWTVASYMIEGGVSKHYIQIKRLMVEDPIALHELLGKVADTTTAYLKMQVEAGAQVLQLFDSWGGMLDEAHYQAFVLPYQQQVFAGLKGLGVPLILYVNHSRGLLPMMMDSGADVLSIDWHTSLLEARRIAGSRFALQGNLDPASLFLNPLSLKPLVLKLLEAGGHQGYIFNLGHGILPDTPIEAAQLIVDTVKAAGKHKTLLPLFTTLTR